MDDCCFNANYSDNFLVNTINNYVTNIINYKKHYMLKFTANEFERLLYWLQLKNLNIPLLNEKYNCDYIDQLILTRNNFKNLINPFTSDELIKIINVILQNTGTANGDSNIQILLNFIKNYCTYDKIKKNNIVKLLKLNTINRFPLVTLEYFYGDDKDIELIEYFLTYKLNDNAIFDLIINKNFMTCTNDELFKMAFEKGNINIIKHFINKKFIITEDMILKNFSENILEILLLCSENGFYITEKCFKHIIYVMYINSLSFNMNVEKIKKCSIYVNDTEEFEKHKIIMKDLYDLYTELETNILSNYNNTILYFKDKPITKEMVVISNNKRVREYLINKMSEEREKTIKKVVVKKVVKKVVKA
jgi:hypothetical protein